MAAVNQKEILGFQLCIIGDMGVGKSCLLQRFTDRTYDGSPHFTVGVDVKSSAIPLEGKTIRLLISDIAGIEKYRSVNQGFFKQAHGFIIVFDITREESFRGVNDWLLHLDKLGKINATKILVGNKCDMQEKKEVPFEMAEEFAKKWGMRFLEASAKDGTNVPQIFLGIAADIKHRLYPQAQRPTMGAEWLDISHREDQISIKRSFMAGSPRLDTSNMNRPSLSGSTPHRSPEESPSQLCDYTFNIALIGDSGVGKSSLMLRFTDDRYSDFPTTSVDVEIRSKILELEGHTVELLVKDTVGQERFRSITRSYYRGADGIIIVYDITNKESFDKLGRWIQDIDIYAREDAIKILVGNKSDRTEERVVDQSSAQGFADELGIPFLETSARSATNVDEVFKIIAELIIKRPGPPKNRDNTGNGNNTIHLNAAKKSKKRFGWC